MNIRQVRKKIKSVSNVKKITKAMQLVSAIKMKKSQQLAFEGKPYRENLEKIIMKLVSSLDPGFSILMDPRQNCHGKDLVIFISSNKGLCGAFNFNLFRHVLHALDFQGCDFLTVGKKAAMLVGKMGGNILADFSETNFVENASAIFQAALSAFMDNRYNRVILIYNRFINTLRFEPIDIVILPIKIDTIQTENLSKSEYIVEPSARTIIDSLLKSFVEEKIRGAIIDSEAAEHSARMIAMKNATDNAEDVVYNLTLLRNKLRQEKITYELLDMITAKESVEAT